MKFRNLFLATLVIASFNAFAHDDLDSYNISDEDLQALDAMNAQGQDMSVDPDHENLKGDCMRETCPIYILVTKSQQRADIYIEGKHIKDGAVDRDGIPFVVGKDDGKGRWKVTTGMAGHETPNFDRHFESDSRVFQRYSSSKYPGGDWQGFGNMPFAMFIKGGFAVHGTTGSDTFGNISKLGTKPLSHGCVRIHSENARRLNALVKKYGVKNTWVRVIP